MAYGDYKTRTQLRGSITTISAASPDGAPAAWIHNGESAEQSISNRPADAIAANCDELKARFDADLAIGEFSAFTESGGGTSSITIDPDNGGGSTVNFDGSLYLGTVGNWPSGQEGRDTLFELLDSDFNEVVVNNAKVVVSACSEVIPGGFHTTGIVTLTLSDTIPNGNYRLGYGIGTTLATMPEAGLMKLDVRGLHEASGQQPADMVQYSGGPAWHDGTTNPATDVEAQLDKVVTDLVSNDGSDRIGATAKTSDFEPMVAGSIEDQIVILTARLDAIEKRDVVHRAIDWTISTDASQIFGLSVPNGIAVGYNQQGLDPYTRQEWVIVGGDGTSAFIATGWPLVQGSTPYSNWTTPGFGATTPMDLHGVAWGIGATANGVWVAVGKEGPSPGPNGAVIMYSVDAAGTPWSRATVPAPYNSGNWVFYDVIYDPTNAYFILVGTDGAAGVAVLRSNDGVTWTAPTTPMTNRAVRLVTDEAGVVLGYSVAGLSKSTDGGDTWSNIAQPLSHVAYDARSGRWAGLVPNATWQDFYLSDDGTATSWSLVTSGASGGATERVYGSVGCDGRGLILLTGAPGELRWTTDYGTNWNFMPIQDPVQPTDEGLNNVPAKLRYLAGRFIQPTGGSVDYRLWISKAQDSAIRGPTV